MLYRQPVPQELPTRHGTSQLLAMSEGTADESGVSGDDVDGNGEKEAWTTVSERVAR